MFIVDLFNLIFYTPIVNLLIFIYKQLEGFGVPGALGFSIVILTFLIRMIIWPFTSAQIKSTKRLTELKPHLDQLKKTHQGDANSLRLAQGQLYKEHGVNPAAGCLPTLLQIPVFIALYQAILHVFPSTGGSVEQINKILYSPALHLDKIPDPNFLAFNIATKPSEMGLALAGVPILTALLTFVQIKMTMPSKIKIYPNDTKPEVKEKESMEDMMMTMQTQMLYLMPIMVGYFGFQFPVGLAIYWNTLTIISIIQQYKLSGWGGMADLFKRVGIKVGDKKTLETKPETKVIVERVPSKKSLSRSKRKK